MFLKIRKHVELVSMVRKFAVLAVFFEVISTPTFASNSDWLSLDLNTRQNISFDQDPGSRPSRDSARDFFNDDANLSVTVTQSVRGMMDPSAGDGAGALVEGMLSADPQRAADWFAGIPAPTKNLNQLAKTYFECELDAAESVISCDDGSQSAVRTGTSDMAPKQRVYGEELVSQIIRRVDTSDLPSVGEAKQSAVIEQQSSVVLIARSEGLLTVEGGKIEFSANHLTRFVELDKNLKASEWSVFIRDSSIVTWDEAVRSLTSKKPGSTEMFVVTPGRISIIPLIVGGNNKSLKTFVRNYAPQMMQVASGLASLDGLDSAAAKTSLAASITQSPQLATPADLAVNETVTQLGSDGLAAYGQVVRAKAKVSFDSVRLQLVDERSPVAGQSYPLSGVRVKVAGTDFSEVTNARGEVDIREIPTGSRILVEITDDRGHVMPQATEIVADRDGVARTISQRVRTRRFSSLDLIARSGGVVQDMRKSSFCGILHNGAHAQADVSVALDVYANGPFYFNNLGLVDLRRSGTGGDGQFCFFNVEPGPVTVSVRRPNEKYQLSGLLGLIPGRHTEEAIDLSDAKHLTTTATAIPGANEQLGSDLARANRRDLIEQAELFAVGSGSLMVPMEQGFFTTPSRVLTIKGRVWTVSSTQDFETVVQPLMAKTTTARQVSTLIPNGFISDMAVFANTTHDVSLGSVLVEHGHLAGHGNESVKFRLVDFIGRDVGDGWYFSDNPVTKAVFFNVPPGVYSLIVETADGHWISADTTVVYSESVSFVKTGSPLERLRSSVQRALAN